MLKHIFIVCFFTSLCFSQEKQIFFGKTYLLNQLVKDVKVINLSKKISTYSNEEGIFEIRAAKSDSILFSSVFLKNKVVVMNVKHLNREIKIDLIEKINQLEEVIVTEDYIIPHFDLEKYNTNLQKQISIDIKTNPIKYGASYSTKTDFFKLFGFITSILKKRSVNDPKITINYNDLSYLFEMNSFFTKKMLAKDLKVTKEIEGLFFIYFETQKIDAKLLTEDHQFDLLDSLIVISKRFFDSMKIDVH